MLWPRPSPCWSTSTRFMFCLGHSVWNVFVCSGGYCMCWLGCWDQLSVWGVCIARVRPASTPLKLVAGLFLFKLVNEYPFASCSYLDRRNYSLPHLTSEIWLTMLLHMILPHLALPSRTCCLYSQASLLVSTEQCSSTHVHSFTTGIERWYHTQEMPSEKKNGNKQRSWYDMCAMITRYSAHGI